MEILAVQPTAHSLPGAVDRHVWCLPDADLTQAAHARRRAAGVLQRWRLPRATVDDAVLVVCELVTNAIRHGRSPVHIALDRRHGALTISVSDHGSVPYPRQDLDTEAGRDADSGFDYASDSGFTTGPAADHSEEFGRGLAIVAALSQAHGYEGGRKNTFWARLHTQAVDPD